MVGTLSTQVHGIELLHFCEPEESRFAFKRPYIKSGFLTATDGKILIAFPSSEPETPSEKRTPDPMHVLEKIVNIESNLQWPETFSRCSACGNVRMNFPRLREKCLMCKGDGFRECNLNHEHECSACDGRGWTGGYQCHNEESSCNIELCGKKFDRQYISRINALPGPLMYGVSGDMLVVRGPNEMTVVLMALNEDACA